VNEQELDNSYTPEFRFTRWLDTSLAKFIAVLNRKALAVGNLLLVLMPIVFLLAVVRYAFPSNYLLEFLAVFVGQASGLLMLVRLEKYRGLCGNKTSLNNPMCG
jgi:hypothetical protein